MEDNKNSISHGLTKKQTHKIVEVDFAGGRLEALHDGQDIWVSVRKVCDNLGIDDKTQKDKIKLKSWATWGLIPSVAKDGKVRDQFMLHVDSFAAWLANIDEHRVADDVRQKLVRYQREAAKALRDHFFGPKQGQAQLSADTYKMRKLQIAAAKEARLLEREKRMARKDTLSEEKTRRKWAVEDRKREAKEKLNEIERLRIAAIEAKKVGKNDIAEALIDRRLEVISGCEISQKKDQRNGINNSQIIRQSSYSTAWFLTSMIADEACLPVQTIAKIVRDLGLKETEHARQTTTFANGKERPTYEYDHEARKMILEQAKMIKEEEQLRKFAQMSLLDRMES